MFSVLLNHDECPNPPPLPPKSTIQRVTTETGSSSGSDGPLSPPHLESSAETDPYLPPALTKTGLHASVYLTRFYNHSELLLLFSNI